MTTHIPSITTFGAITDADTDLTERSGATTAVRPSAPSETTYGPQQCNETHPRLFDLEKALCGENLSAKRLGELGEQYAALWLGQRSWRVLERNWRSRFGELDVIMQQPDTTLVFVEVKTRRTLRYGTPQEAIDRNKQINLRRTATLWLNGVGKQTKHLGIRFDAVSIWVHDDHVLVHHIPGAF